MTNSAVYRSDGPDDAAPPANAPAGGLGREKDEQARPVPTATLHEMLDACHDEAVRIETMQEILVRGGSRRRPDTQMTRKMEVFQATVLFLEACDLRRRAIRQALDGPVEHRR